MMSSNKSCDSPHKSMMASNQNDDGPQPSIEASNSVQKIFQCIPIFNYFLGNTGYSKTNIEIFTSQYIWIFKYFGTMFYFNYLNIDTNETFSTLLSFI